MSGKEHLDKFNTTLVICESEDLYCIAIMHK